MVQADNAGIESAELTLGNAVYDAAVITTTDGSTRHLLGAVLACFDYRMDPLQYIPAATAGDSTTAGYVLVADHPAQQFVAQTDGALTANSIDLNHEITSATLSAPDTRTGMSTQEIAMSGANVTATIPLRLYGLAFPTQDVISAAGCRMVCQINPDCHQYGAGTAI
jgi:hypothetical protein